MIQPDAKHFQRNDTAKLAISLSTPASFKFMYWPINAVGSTGREIMAYGDAKWENLSPEAKEKLRTPFHVLPILYISSEDGEDLVLSEAIVVEHYLAKQFGLLGDNEYQESLIKVFHSSSSHVQANFAQMVTWSLPEVKAKQLDFFKSSILPTWIQTHEKHLADNGNNGHYVGNKLSLADIRTACAIEHFAVQPEASELMEIVNKSVALCKVRETVAVHPKIAPWRASEQYQKLSQGSVAFFANPFAFIPPPPKNSC
ncbi:hypothetical protein EDD21DRAFT_412893 [Dissophora ornata]|nr:hypothetical protein EDD21DRAFT_412893 [Dissophora ornata]